MARRLVLLDACQPITFGSAGRFDLILDLKRHAVAIGARASREVVRDPARSLVRTAIEAGVLPVESIDLRDPPVADLDLMREIVRYNEIDCRVLMDVVGFLRARC